MNVEPLEKIDPFLGEQFKKIANGTHEKVQRIDNENIIFKPVSSNKIKRNDTCPCGSGKKYKKCCLKG